MATGTQRALDKRLSHSDRVELNINSANLLSEPDEIFESWRRCFLEYGVKAADFSAPQVVTQNELKVFREPLENIHVKAQAEIDRLYAVLRQHGYVVLLCNRQGVAIYHRGDETKASEFKHWGIWVGGVWSEEAEGNFRVLAQMPSQSWRGRGGLFGASRRYSKRVEGVSRAAGEYPR